MINWTKIRNQFPATEKYTYLNAGSTSPISISVAKAGKQFYDEIQQEGVMAWEKWEERILETRQVAAKLMNTSTREIAFTINTGHGMNIIADMLKDKGEVLTMDNEYPTSTIPWIHRGIKVRFVKPKNNIYTMNDIEEQVTSRTKVLVVSHIQYSSGFRHDLIELGKLCKRRNLIFIVNATQSGMIFPIDVKRANIDFLVFAGYKWTCSGFGNGVLYINKKWLKAKDLPMVGSESVKDWDAMDNKKFKIRSDAAVLEMGALHFSPIFALGAALKLISKLGQGNMVNRILRLNKYLVNELLKNPNIKIVTPLESKYRSGITYIKIPNVEKVYEHLQKKKVIVSLRKGMIRISVSFYNNGEDIDRMIAILQRMLK